MVLFWIAAFLIAALVAGLILGGLHRGGATSASGQAHDLQVYRDQLKEVERDRDRGVLSPDDADRTRTEVSRRILDADNGRPARGGEPAPRAATLGASVGVAALLFVGSASLYLAIGAPGYRDMPLAHRLAAAEQARAERPDQAAAEARSPAPDAQREPDPRYVRLVERLRAAVAERPEDRQGLALLVRHEAALGNFTAAYQAQARLIAAKGEEATAGDYAARAGYLIRAAGGYVSPAAERAVARALERDSANGPAGYYAGLLDAQTGRPDRAFRRWRTLLEESPPDAPWVRPIRARIVEAARRAGIRYTLPEREAAPKPAPDQMAAARDMSADDRGEMIRGMVAGLADRLRSEGGSAAEWARLVRAYGVLDKTDEQEQALAEAEAALEGSPRALARVRAAAEGEGGRAPASTAAEARRLSRRLAERGGGPGHWARLVTLLAETGETGRARAIWQEAQSAFADAPEALSTIREAAGGAGLLE